MTDEEKAEEYTDNIDTLIYDIEDNPINIAIYLRKAYLVGLAEGRKEKYEMALSQIKNDREKVIEYNERLEKEKCELLGIIQGKDEVINQLKNNYKKQRNKRIDELQKKNAELKAQIESDNLAFNESNEIIAELKEQNEHLRNCFNCKNNSSKTSVFCQHFKDCGKNKEKWEMGVCQMTN